MDPPEKYYTPDEIYQRAGGEFTLKDEELCRLLSRALARAPAYVVDAVFKHCLCAMPDPEQWISFIPNRAIKGRHILLFPHLLKGYSEDEQAQFVLHTIAHYILHHWSPVERQPVNYDKQELEAEGLAHKWMKEWSEQKS